MPVLTSIGEDLAEWGERDSEVLGSYHMAVSQQCGTAARKPAECCRAGRMVHGAKPRCRSHRGRTGQATCGWRVWGTLWSSWLRTQPLMKYM